MDSNLDGSWVWERLIAISLPDDLVLCLGWRWDCWESLYPLYPTNNLSFDIPDRLYVLLIM